MDGEVLVAPDPLGSRSSTTLGAVQLNPGWPADALTLVGWVIGLTAGTLVATAPLFGRYLPCGWWHAWPCAASPDAPVVGGGPRVRGLLRADPGGCVAHGLRRRLGGSAQSLGMPFWPLVGLVALVAVAPLLLGLPLTVLHGTTLSEGIGAAWVLARGRRLAHLLCLMPLAALLLLPGAVEDRLSGALAGTGTGLALGVPLGVKVLLVLSLAPLPVLLLTGQALWARRPPGGTEAASSLDQLSDGRLVLDHLDRRGAPSEAPPRRPLAAPALATALVLVPLVTGAALGANPHGAPGVTSQQLTRSEFAPLAEGHLPTEDGTPAPPTEVTRADGRPLIGDRVDEVRLRDCRDAACSEWDTVSLGGGAVNAVHGPPGVAVDDRDRPRVAYVDGISGMLTFLACDDAACTTWESTELLAPRDLPIHMSAANPSGYAPVRILSVDGARPELLMGRQLITCADPLCGLPV
ncbi:hypothetical protein KGD82_25775 [Nocardiopsis eucommiae]|uniref:Uncharacterized protein n=1 Tax=Nocardiopsis eucommiae TaxID=2831970 RepID=A0A975QJ93_9ACTN|nr:hypothetical protein KGD82_25775 [Nocardiopsis eucommiae]